MQILVLDDDPRLRRLLTVMLRTEGYDILEAEEGEQALALLAEEPALIVLDLMLPGMDGETFHGQAREAGYQGPVLVLSAAPYGMLTARRLGAHFIPKPFDPTELLDMIARLLLKPGRDFSQPTYVSFSQRESTAPDSRFDGLSWLSP